MIGYICNSSIENMPYIIYVYFNRIKTEYKNIH